MRSAAEGLRVGERGDLELRLVRLSDSELVLLNNALNEVLHGVGIEEPEFSTRLGGSRAEARRLLDRLGRLVRVPDAVPGASSADT